MTQNLFAVRTPRDDDFDAWAALYRGYRAFYRLAPDEAVVERVWSWVHDPDHELQAFVAVGDGETVVGLANYRRFARPSTGSVGLWLDDLFTHPQHRAQGVGRNLIAAVADVAERDGCSIVRWITAADNHAGQRLYDAIATKTAWVTYDKPVAG